MKEGTMAAELSIKIFTRVRPWAPWLWRLALAARMVGLPRLEGALWRLARRGMSYRIGPAGRWKPLPLPKAQVEIRLAEGSIEPALKGGRL